MLDSGGRAGEKEGGKGRRRRGREREKRREGRGGGEGRERRRGGGPCALETSIQQREEELGA